MATIPTTSVTLLKDLARDAPNARWAEFCRVYEAPMRAYLRAHYPSVEHDDILQETLIALSNALPDYHYTPDAKGHFRNYLIGILRHKALDTIRKNCAQAKTLEGYRAEADAAKRSDGQTDASAAAESEWRNSLAEAAIEQLMSDETIPASKREIFRHVALLHEKPEDVARLFNVSRANVDQIKKRMIGRLSEMVRAMTTI